MSCFPRCLGLHGHKTAVFSRALSHLMHKKMLCCTGCWAFLCTRMLYFPAFWAFLCTQALNTPGLLAFKIVYFPGTAVVSRILPRKCGLFQGLEPPNRHAHQCCIFQDSELPCAHERCVSRISCHPMRKKSISGNWWPRGLQWECARVCMFKPDSPGQILLLLGSWWQKLAKQPTHMLTRHTPPWAASARN